MRDFDAVRLRDIDSRMKSIGMPDLENAFSRAWRATFGRTPPLGYILRLDFCDNWTRFHALPKSKRYACNMAERNIILQRANSLVEACFPDCESLWLVTADYGASDIHPYDLAARLEMKSAFSWVDESEAPEDQVEVTFFAKKVLWKPRALDWLFTEVAEERGKAIIFDEGQRTVFAPYDGGFDIISLKRGKIGALETNFGSWMSEGPDKL